MEGSRYMMMEDPLAAKPYLWVSHDIEVTPSTRKSNGVVGKPAFSKNGMMKLPRQQSTWRPTLYFLANLPNATISSAIPWGKLTAEPAIYRTVIFLEFLPYPFSLFLILYHDGIFGDGVLHLLDVYLECNGIDRNSDQLDIKVIGSLHESSVNCIWHNPRSKIHKC